MKARLEGIALLKDGTIKITCPLAEGAKLSDLDALRGKEIAISIIDESEPLPGDVAQMSPTELTLHISRLLHDLTVACKESTGRNEILTIGINALAAKEGIQLALGRTGPGEMHDEIPEPTGREEE